MRCSKPFAAAVALALFAVTGAAGAQNKGTDYSYHFEEDLMVGDGLSSPPPLLELRRHPPRIMLIRPRTHFVAELLKSVEVL